MSKFAVVTVSLAVLLFGGILLDQGTPAAPPMDPEEPFFLDTPELAGYFGLRYVELRVEFFTRRHQPIKPPPGIKPVEPEAAGAPSDAGIPASSRGMATFLGANGGGTGYGFGGGGGTAAPSSERSAEPALGALRDVNRALGY